MAKSHLPQTQDMKDLKKYDKLFQTTQRSLVLWAFYFHDPSNVQKQRQSTKQKYHITIANTLVKKRKKRAKR